MDKFALILPTNSQAQTIMNDVEEERRLDHIIWFAQVIGSH